MNRSSAVTVIMDCNPALVFPILGFGIDVFVSLASRYENVGFYAKMQAS